MDINTALRTGFVRLPVELSEKELKSLKRIIGGEVEALARLIVRVKVKREAAAISNPQAEHAGSGEVGRPAQAKAG